MHQLFATYLMPTTLSWEGLLLLFRRKFSTLFALGIIKEFAIAYEDLPMYFEIDEHEHNIPVCHCWCHIDSRMFDASFVHEKLRAMGLMLIDQEHEVTDEYIRGMRDVILRYEDCLDHNKYIRWKVVNHGGMTRLVRVDMGEDPCAILAHVFESSKI